jgi:hypothetical protein
VNHAITCVLVLGLGASLSACNAILGIGDLKPGADGDAGIDANPNVPPDVPKLRGPRLGATTGSARADAALRPTFTWRAAPGAARYELAVDDSCQTASFKTCVFPSPELSETAITTTSFAPAANLAVSLSQPVGRRYFWRVRACNPIGCSDWSEVWYLDVGRLGDDINGDGYGDLVVGIGPSDTSVTKTGAAYLLFGYATGGVQKITKLTDRSSQDGSRFGTAAAIVGDVNADGYADVLIGAPGIARGNHTGAAYLYLGRATWTATVAMETTAIDALQEDPDKVFAGVVRGGGDVDGDGYADFAIASGADNGGYVRVYFGKPTWSYSLAGSNLVAADPAGGAMDVFGFAIALEDLNQDGRADLLIGAPLQASGVGGAVAYFGQPTYPSAPYTLQAPDVTIASDLAAMSYLGWSIATCASKTRATSLAIGAAWASHPQLGEGLTQVYAGRPSWPANLATADQTLVDPLDSPRDLFGSAVRCADVTGDGEDDLVVGAPSADDYGAISIYPNAATVPLTLLSTLTTGVAPKSDTIGYSLALTDYNGDGVPDVFASAPRLAAPTETGTVLGWLGRATWPSTLVGSDLRIDNPSAIANEWFGRVID